MQPLGSVFDAAQHPPYHREIAELHEDDTERGHGGMPPVVGGMDASHQACARALGLQVPDPGAVGLGPQQPPVLLETRDPEGPAPTAMNGGAMGAI